MPETDTASAITFALLSATTVAVSPASTTTTVAQVFNPLYGYRVSDPLDLPGDPVTASVIRWSATVPAGATLTVETSINYGASWDVATSGKAIPRLRPRDTATRAVLTRLTLTRSAAGGSAPTVSSLEVVVTCDSGVYEWIPIATGVIDKPTAKTSSANAGSGSGGGPGVTARGGGQHGGGPSVRVHCVDSSYLIRSAQWEMPFFVPAGMNYAAAVKAMVLDRLPGHARFSMVSTTRLVPSLLVFGLDQGGDPWKDITEAAAAFGYECFFDPTDTFRLQPVADPRYTVPVLEIDQAANPVITEAQSELDLETVVNYVIVRGESTSSKNPVSAFAFDNDPQSLTYVGRIGKRVKRYTFPLIQTKEDAQAAANAILFNSLGAANTVTLTMMPHPCLEPGDAVKVSVADINVAGTYVVQQVLPMPVSPNDPMRLVCYRQTDNTTTAA